MGSSMMPNTEFDLYIKSNVTVLKSRAIDLLLSKLRDKNTNCAEFTFYGDRLMRILAEESLAHIPAVRGGEVITPCGSLTGLIDYRDKIICVVSIQRSGDILQEAVRTILPGIGIGKILVQRDESSPEKNPVYYYKNFPKNISDCYVILADPMLATGGSVKVAISVLIEAGVSESNIMFINLICCPEGLRSLKDAYPNVKVVTCCIDKCLNEHKYIVPGLGDYGDRYYGTG
ncbi:uracil phosphoribosyltransferase [Hydra vulgaris]|uniref:uracil phosphoribosyltransferase n=1 Tax=Hydra vulgaris TaxID=6087 RepID=UPI0001924078|nr:uracil phosphoribosyltransferase [Hydra vulgaris]XP_012561072.1 uracil phosphoribosyltransferase [Hydra vulgaris]